jgi:outer membrane lipoprotein SlyB
MKIMPIILLFAFVLSGCAATQGTKMDADNIKEVKNVKTVSVATFKCSDPIIAQDLKNKLVESLLSNYSVVIGDNADVLITGEVTLKNNIVSKVKADILKDQDVLATVSVAQSGGQNSPGVMGKKMGEKIMGVLSKE